MNSPTLDNRDKNAILKQMLNLAKLYIPEWNQTHSDGDPGLVLMQIFSEMFAETIRRYNKMPYKNFIYFLDLLGSDILPCSASHGYITIEISRSDGLGVFIEKGKRVYGEDKNNEKIIFEIQDDVCAVENKITDIFCKSIKNTIVHLPIEQNNTNDEPHLIKLFDFHGADNLQKQSLIMAGENILNIKNIAQISVSVINTERTFMADKTAEKLSNPDYAAWYYLSETGWKRLRLAGTVSNKISIDTEKVIPLTEFNGITNRWLRCVIDNTANPIEISLTDCHLSAQADNVQPEFLYSNDLSLLKNNFMPFSENFSRYDSFYIGSEEVFTKKSAFITIEFTMQYQKISIGAEKSHKVKWKHVMPASALNKPDEAHIYIEDIVWEYWNGNGWLRLFENEMYNDIFKRGTSVKISFVCPSDIETSFIGGIQNYFIRARINKLSNIFINDGYYISPIIENINMSYSYKHESVPADILYVEKDLTLITVQRGEGEIRVNSETEKSPTAYLALDKPLPKGIIKLYFQNHTELHSHYPLKFEYFSMVNGIRRWVDLKFIDETKNFAESGLITFICKDKFEKLSLFSMEKYWIRIINTDNRYEQSDSSEIPCFKGIYFNTVKVKQSEAMETEYFYIEYGEINKICNLIGKNIISESVWINEKDELEDSKDKWIKWHRVQSFNESLPDDSVYILDPIKGIITFGNGKKGKIPLSGKTDTIKVEYSIGGGRRGNLEAYSIEGFADSIPFISKVYNVEPIIGGCDVEGIEDAIARSCMYIKHQNRIVSGDDCETIAAANRNIAKVKVYRSENGGLTIAILPIYVNSPGDYFSTLKKQLLQEIGQKAPAVLTYANKINIVEVKYIEFCVTLHVTVADYHCYQNAYKELEIKLKEYFHPVTGNHNGKGFDIGILPTKIQIINYLKCSSIISIDRVYINCYERLKESRKELDYDKAVRLLYTVPLSGEPEIEISVQEE